MRYTTWDVIEAASYMLDHDINPDDDYAVEQFLRKHKLGGRRREFITAVIKEAIELRDRKRLHGLFEYINSKVPVWPDDKKVSDDFKIEIADDVGHELHCLLQQGDDVVGSEMERIARCVALLLIQQAAWRKHDDEMKAGYAQAEAEGTF
jgi:hypothetical protein